MNQQLMMIARGEVIPARQDREVAVKAKTIYDQVRLAGLKVDGTVALARHVMDRAVELDNYRVQLAQGDPIRDLMLAEIELTGLRNVKRIQENLAEQWGL